MDRILIAFVFAAAAACSPPEAPPPSELPAAADEASAPEADLGPYSNTWDSDETSRFRHTLHAVTPGPHTVTLSAQTNSPAGETVAVYPIGPDGQARTNRLMFAIATTTGASEVAEIDFPEGGEGVEVEVAVENMGGRRHQGSYSLTVTP